METLLKAKAVLKVLTRVDQTLSPVRSEEKDYQAGFNLESNMLCLVCNNLILEKITRFK